MASRVGQGVDAVERALAIVTAFRGDKDTLSLAELAERTGLYKSTILRLIASLERFGFLLKDADGAYRLGQELWRLGSLYARTFDPARVIRPVLQRLVEVTEETASFYVRAGDERVCLYRVNSPRSTRHHLEEGVRLPLDRGAAGRVLLAFGGRKGAIYEKIRSEKEYVSLGERDREIAAAAVPVFDGSAQLCGALAISGPLSRFDAKAQALALKALHREAAGFAALLPGPLGTE
jgi:DNA-binding IclR family transcriptional regulator